MQGSLMPKSFSLMLGCRMRSDRVSLAKPLRMHDEGNVQWTLACRFAQKALGLHMAEDTESCARRSSSSLASL